MTKLSRTCENQIKLSKTKSLEVKVFKVLKRGLKEFEEKWKFIDSIQLYFDLVTNENLLLSYIDNNEISKELSESSRFCYENRCLDNSDLAGIFLIDDMLFRGYFDNNNKVFDYLVIDEGQDYNPFEFYLLSKLTRGGGITILGDLGQSIRDHRSINEWSEVTESISNSISKSTNYLELSLTYRSTSQITNYSNNIIRSWSQGKYTLHSRQANKKVVWCNENINIFFQFNSYSFMGTCFLFYTFTYAARKCTLYAMFKTSKGLLC